MNLSIYEFILKRRFKQKHKLNIEQGTKDDPQQCPRPELQKPICMASRSQFHDKPNSEISKKILRATQIVEQMTCLQQELPIFLINFNYPTCSKLPY